MWNQLEYRGLEGFVYAVTPFNFTVDRRQPADRAGADGQHGRLEAGVERDVLRLLPDEAVRGGRPAARRHQLRRRRRGDDLEGAALAPRSRGRPFHRQHRGLQRHVEDHRRLDVHLPLLPAHRRRDGRQGLHRRPPVGGRRRAGGRDRARRVRVPGAEVLGGEPRLRAEIDVGRRARSRGRDDRRDQDGRRPGFPELHGRGDRQARVRQDQRLRRARARQREDHRRRQGATAARATSSARRWSKPTTPATGCCARRSSDRSSPPTSTTMRSGRRR